jgi:hypothetical protein
MSREVEWHYQGAEFNKEKKKNSKNCRADQLTPSF